MSDCAQQNHLHRAQLLLMQAVTTLDPDPMAHSWMSLASPGGRHRTPASTAARQPTASARTAARGSDTAACGAKSRSYPQLELTTPLAEPRQAGGAALGGELPWRGSKGNKL